MNYAELRTEIQDTCENDETRFVASIPSFIRRAEQQIFYDVQLPLFRANVEGQVSSGSRYLTLPDDFKAPLSLRIIDGEYLLNKDVNFIREAYPGSVQAAPRYYALFDDDSIILAPIPDQPYQMELHYAREPVSLTEGTDDGTTWLSVNAQNAILYGSVMYGYIFMKGEKALIDEYTGKFQVAVNSLKNLGEARNRKDTYRGGELRTKVR